MKYFWDTLLDADLESDALGWQYISGTLPDSREFARIDNPQIEGYSFDPNGEYVRRWLPELARLPTEWIHHPYDAPEYVLQSAGIELGSNYPLPIVTINAAKSRLQEALTQMWQHEANSIAVLENGTQEGLGDSSDNTPIAFPQDMQMEMDLDTVRNHTTTTIRHYEDQMVPSMTTSLLLRGVEDEEESFSDRRDIVTERRAEVPNEVMNQELVREPISQELLGQGFDTQAVLPQFNIQIARRNSEDSQTESSTSRRERDGGVVPVWAPTTSSSYSEENSYLQRHPQYNWRQLSQTG